MNVMAKRFVRINTETDELFQDVTLMPEEAACLNEKLAADCSEYRWVPYGSREGDTVAA
jgi:hypothetical protein